MDFIKSFLQYTEHYESPTAFWKWSAYATIAAILRDSIYISQMDKKLYPNIYVLIMADSAVQRKDLPVELSTLFVSKISNTKVINGRSSIQAILDELAKAGHNDQGIMLKGGSALFSASELSANIVNDPEAINILTDIYGFKENYVSRLRSGGFHIKNVCFTMLAASNKELLIPFFDNKAVYGGLLGRTFLILPDEFRAGNSLWNTHKRPFEFEDLLKMLANIAMLRGEMYVEESAKAEYDNWYLPFRKSYEKKPDKSGVAGRIHTSVLKVAMINAVNQTLELVLRKTHIEEAINDCLQLMNNYSQLTMSSGKSPNAEVGAIILTEIIEAPDHTLSKRKLLQKHWNDFDNETMDKVINTLVTAGFVMQSVENNDIVYKLTQLGIDRMVVKKESKNASGN